MVHLLRARPTGAIELAMGGVPFISVLAWLAFLAGATAGALLVEGHREHNAAAALWLEAALLAGAAVWTARLWELLALAFAMGVQNIALTGSPLGAHTTHITGPLTDFPARPSGA